MTGAVDLAGRALLAIDVRSEGMGSSLQVEAWVDTAFDGELVLCQDIIVKLGLPQSAAVSVTLADGATAVLETYSCIVRWGDVDRRVEVKAKRWAVSASGRWAVTGAAANY